MAIQNFGTLKRLTADIVKANNTPLNVTDLSFTLKNGKFYYVRGLLCTTSGVTGGFRVGWGGTVTATAFSMQMLAFKNSSASLSGVQRLVLLSGAMGQDGDLAGHQVSFEGMINPSADGTFMPTFCQVTTDATPATLLAQASIIRIEEMS